MERQAEGHRATIRQWPGKSALSGWCCIPLLSVLLRSFLNLPAPLLHYLDFWGGLHGNVECQ